MSEAARSTGDTRQALLARADELTRSEPGFARFLLETVEATDPEDLAAYDGTTFETILRASFARFGKRDPSGVQIEIQPAPGRLPTPTTIIDIVSDDRPFLLDSVLGALRAAGIVPRLIAHPILDADPRTDRPLARPAPGAARLSYLHLHVEPFGTGQSAEALESELRAVLRDVARVVDGWRPMLERLRQVIGDLRRQPPDLPMATVTEAVQFLAWLADHNFTFLGMRQYRLVQSGRRRVLEPIPESGLGLLEDPDYRFMRSGSDYVEMTDRHGEFLASPDLLLVTKANTRSRVHRRSHMDYVGLKLFDDAGNVDGELRILGLFTSMSLSTPHRDVPLIRTKLTEVMHRSDLDPQSHAGKALMAALETYPRDELFQIDVDKLAEFAGVIAGLADRPRVRVLSRVDRFDNFVSILLYVPRERYSAEARARIADHLARRYDGRVSAWYPNFLEGDLVRAHIIIGRNGGPTPRPPRHLLEAEVTDLTRSFGDRVLAAAPDPAAIAGFRDAFPPAYEAANSPERALADIALLKALPDDAHIAVRFGKATAEGEVTLAVYHRHGAIALSDRVPLLENFGFHVIDEQTHDIAPRTGGPYTLHDMLLALPPGQVVESAPAAARLEEALLAVWDGLAENDRYNQLVLSAQLSWRDAAILRALGRYLRQAGIGFSQGYLANVLAGHQPAAIALVNLFHALNDPGFSGDREAAAADERKIIDAALDATTSLDEDRIIRRFRAVVEAVLRTNAYQRGPDRAPRPALALKLDTAAIDFLPKPRPFREIFVYSPRVEGVHLRMGPIARGGIRWSDRPEDYRTEVLGLVKAQQVKNAVIVPVGAKGGFLPKNLPTGDREAVQKEGVAAYSVFIGTLLDVTDNLDGDRLLPPEGVRRRDSDDPYLVVAADKGTASFSDTANAIALERRFWLGDAFASGGSAGYDHKRMGITARGAFEAVKRHFREMDRDVTTEPFTVVGVGDMSGDVFGNGMLLAPNIRLLAAFDHRDIFIDPDPDPATALAERQRLFALPRSSWQDYAKSLISDGGGVFSRSLKSIPLSPQIKALLGLSADALTPAELISAILRAEVELLWFGGIGTYVRASTETDMDAGDRANDGVRVTGAELRCKVVGEGANLAMTQRARIEYALAGGRLNTDAIDNSAGVNSSDLEVNIKIALGTLLRAKKLALADRNHFLATMTDEVAALCLEANYRQPLAISLAQRSGMAGFGEQVELIDDLEAAGELDRKIEFLPDDVALAERRAEGAGLTRPEMAVLLAYAKLDLFDRLVASLPEDAYLVRELNRYFPPKLVERYPEAIAGHRLRPEIIATILSNAMINRGGPAFANALMAATSADAGRLAEAYIAARDAFGLDELEDLVDACDARIPGDLQLTLYAALQDLLTGRTLWFLRNGDFEQGLAPLVKRHARGVVELGRQLAGLVPEDMRRHADRRFETYRAGGVSEALARRIADLPDLAHSTDIAAIADRAGVSTEDAAGAWFGAASIFGVGGLLAGSAELAATDRFDRMALDRAIANLTRALRDLSADILAEGSGPISSRLAAWKARRLDLVNRTTDSVRDLTEGGLSVSRLSVAAGLLADLARGS